jgi:intein/homing endonuclease
VDLSYFISYSGSNFLNSINISSSIVLIVHKKKEGQKDKRFNPLNQELIKLNLKCKAPYKFIPEIYKYSSIEDRYELIRGILDTDGSISSNGHIELKTSSKTLAEDFMWVLRSLGIQCRVGILDMRDIPQKMHTGQITYTEHIYYRVYVKTDRSVFKLKRKLDKIKSLKRKRKTSIVKLEYLGEFPTFAGKKEYFYNNYRFKNLQT